MSLPLMTRGQVDGRPLQSVLKVLTLNEFLRSPFQASECALWCNDSDELTRSRALQDVQWGATLFAPGARVPIGETASPCRIHDLRQSSVVGVGDVVSIDERRHLVNVLYRRGSRSNSLLATEHCNSYCVMCSQPPLQKNESGRLEHLKTIVRLIDRTEQQLGITGGEPTLLGDGLIDLLQACGNSLPQTHLHVLTNGRKFSDEAFATRICEVSGRRVTWGIPVYSDAPDVHDFVVQRPGAFSETLAGLLNLARHSQGIEIRVVLQKAVAPRIKQLAHFIARNLPFVDQVSWMGLEPMGFARPNWNAIWIEPDDYVDELADAIVLLGNHRISTSIFNLPLCVLHQHLRPYAMQSISDWKNDFLPVCEGCDLRDQCCGFFSSVDKCHIPRSVHAIKFAAAQLAHA